MPQTPMAEAHVPRRTPAARAKPVAQQRPAIEIHIEGHFNSKVYTSGSAIAGHALVRTQRDTPFHDFDIIFTGIAATRLDFVQQYPSHSFRPFMKLRMPMAPSSLPEARVFRAGVRYAVPFNFVVPHQLTLGACNHPCTGPAVREHHLRLPPTVGFWEADDQAPEMAQIEYSIKARAYRAPALSGPPIKFMEGYRMVKVLPAFPEDPPLAITRKDERYSLSKTKTIRKNLFSAKGGKLTASASQPGAIMLSADGHTAAPSSARVDLDFLSSPGTPPPKINSIAGKLTAVTFFGAAPTDLLPNLGRRSAYTANPSLSYTTNSSLFSRCTVKVAWKQKVCSRRDSGYSSFGIEDEGLDTDGSGAEADRRSKKRRVRHKAVLEIPFTIPLTNRKLFLPSFHSCLISRTYTLHLALSVGQSTNSSISLDVPLQIGVDMVHEPSFDGGLPSFESTVAEDEEAEIDAYLQPRTLRIPAVTNQVHSMLPGYEEWGRRTILVA